MNNRRSFFKSLAMLAGMATITPAGLRLRATTPTPTPRELITKTFTFKPSEFYGTWRFESGAALIIDAPTVYAIKPMEDEELKNMVFHLRQA